MDRRGLGRRVAPAIVLVALAGLAGCGADSGGPTAEEPTTATSSSEGPTSSPAPADAPACEEVWAAGETIPRGYRGCSDESGGYVERDGLACSSGQRMVTYADRFYGVIGGTVREAADSLEDDPEYRKAVRGCRA
jgi:hypothetical protein